MDESRWREAQAVVETSYDEKVTAGKSLGVGGKEFSSSASSPLPLLLSRQTQRLAYIIVPLRRKSNFSST